MVHQWYVNLHFQWNVFIVKIVNTYCDKNALVEGKIDYSKVNPLFFDMPQLKYWNLGNIYASSYSIGKQYEAQ